jgi:bifunctional non-homologous end joining protein LigD
MMKKVEKLAINQHMSHKRKRFVIQEHSENSVHWDLMLQIGSVLQTYRLDKAPEEIIHSSANATQIFDHPFRFLTYEGPVHRGKGNVHVIESGTYEIVSQSHDLVELKLNGKDLNGTFTLIHINDENWIFSKSD